MRSYEIGLSAIRTHQLTLDVIGNNIANSATPGYHRQRVDLAPRRPEQVGIHQIGTGVEIANIRRVIDGATQEAILRNDARIGLVDAELAVGREIESLFAPGDSSIHEKFSDFFNNLEAVANSPDVPTVKRELLSSAENLLYQFNDIHEALQVQANSRAAEVSGAISDINLSIAEVAELNQQIRIERAQGREPANLLDRRDSVVRRLSEWADVSVQKNPDGREIVVLGGGVIAVGETASELSVRQEGDTLGVYLDYSSQPLQVKSGRIGGVLEAVNDHIPKTIERLEALAAAIVREVDGQHARGLTENGGFDTLRSGRNAERINAPLVLSGIDFPLQSGEMTLTVTDPSTGVRESHRVAVDPYVDTLSDVTARIDAISGVSAYVSAETGDISISGDGNRKIDFAGRVDNTPDLSSYASTAEPTFSGNYTGARNDEWTVSFNQAGTIGVTDGLTASIVNSNGQLVGTVDVGLGYEAGTELEVGHGISVEFAAGSVATTDTASVLVTEDSDTSGFLAAMGINSLFKGSEIGNYRVRSEILESPDLLAISSTGFPGESSNVAAMANLRDFRFDGLGDQTFIEELADFTADTGLDALQAQSQKEQLEAYGERLAAEESSISGVSTDEEFLELLEVERAFQAITRFITTVDDTLNEIFRIIQ